MTYSQQSRSACIIINVGACHIVVRAENFGHGSGRQVHQVVTRAPECHLQKNMRHVYDDDVGTSKR